MNLYLLQRKRALSLHVSFESVVVVVALLQVSPLSAKKRKYVNESNENNRKYEEKNSQVNEKYINCRKEIKVYNSASSCAK